MVQKRSSKMCTKYFVTDYIYKIVELSEGLIVAERDKVSQLINMFNSIGVTVSHQRCNVANQVQSLIKEYEMKSQFISYSGNKDSLLKEKLSFLRKVAEQYEFASKSEKYWYQAEVISGSFSTYEEEKDLERYIYKPLQVLKDNLKKANQEYCLK